MWANMNVSVTFGLSVMVLVTGCLGKPSDAEDEGPTVTGLNE